MDGHKTVSEIDHTYVRVYCIVTSPLQNRIFSVVERAAGGEAVVRLLDPESFYDDPEDGIDEQETGSWEVNVDE